MATWEQIAGLLVDEAVNREGLQAYVKTDYGPAIKVYDSDAPTSKPSGIIKAAIKITNRDGKTLATLGEWPKTNYIKAGIVVVSLATLFYIMVQGIKRQVTS